MSGELDGFEVVPASRASRSRMAPVMEAFLATGNDCMGKVYGDRRQHERDLCCARDCARRLFPEVEVRKRGDMLVLARRAR